MFVPFGTAVELLDPQVRLLFRTAPFRDTAPGPHLGQTTTQPDSPPPPLFVPFGNVVLGLLVLGCKAGGLPHATPDGPPPLLFVPFSNGVLGRLFLGGKAGGLPHADPGLHLLFAGKEGQRPTPPDAPPPPLFVPLGTAVIGLLGLPQVLGGKPGRFNNAPSHGDALGLLLL